MKTKKLKRLGSTGALGLLALILLFNFSKSAFAAHLNGQINQLQQENQQTDSEQNVLEGEAASLGAKISTLQSEIAELEKQIRDNQVKNAEVQTKITAAETELERQKDLLGQNIKAMYLEGDISTLEMLASSNDLSEFVDKQQYRESLQSKIKDTLDSITALKLELKGQKEALEKLIADQEHMQGQLAAQRAENSRLLALNQNQQAELESEIRQNNARISELRRQQATENARIASGGGRGVPQGVPGGGGYPGKWAFAPIDSLVDSWGMYNRECVSYTAWKVWSTGRFMPYWGGRGNANRWDDNARAAGIPVDTNPRKGDVAVSNAGTYGHTMYVEEVNSDGSIVVSDYNLQWDGVYRIYTISAERVRSSGFVYIHF